MNAFKLLRVLSRVMIAALVVGAVACGGSKGTAGTTTTAEREPMEDPTCPVTIPGTSVAVEDTATGAAMVFVTTGDVAALRERVAALAAMHNEHHGKMGALPDGSEGGSGGHVHGGHEGHAGMEHGGEGGAHEGHAGMDHGAHAGHAGGMIGVHSKAEVVEIEGGVRLELVVGASDVAAIQAELRQHAAHLATGTCAMQH